MMFTPLVLTLVLIHTTVRYDSNQRKIVPPLTHIIENSKWTLNQSVATDRAPPYLQVCLECLQFMTRKVSEHESVRKDLIPNNFVICALQRPTQNSSGPRARFAANANYAIEHKTKNHLPISVPVTVRD